MSDVGSTKPVASEVRDRPRISCIGYRADIDAPGCLGTPFGSGTTRGAGGGHPGEILRINALMAGSQVSMGISSSASRMSRSSVLLMNSS